MPRAKRTIMPGFPKVFSFETREQIDHYLGGDRITCLLCGRDFKALEAHLKNVHKFTCDEYREKYELPYGRGLCSSELSARISDNSSRLFEQNRDRQLAFLDAAKSIQTELGNPQRHKPKFWKAERTIYEHHHFEEFLRRIISGRAVSDVSQDDDMPTSTHVYLYLKKNKEFGEKYKAIVPLFAPTGVRKRKEA